MSEHHDPYGGSRLAQWAHCPHWESGPSGPEAQRGTRIHSAVATGNTSKLQDDDEVKCAYRCISFLEQFKQDNPTFTILQEKWLDGVIEGTGGTADVLAWGDDMAVVIDWKGSDNDPDSAQGKSYALNAMLDLGVHSVRVVFFNYTSGVAGYPAEYHDKGALACEVAAIKERHITAMARPGIHARVPNPGCSWCAKKSHCKEASEVTTADLTVAIADNLDVNSMPIQKAGVMYAKLGALMKRAKNIEAALKDRLIQAIDAGETGTGYRATTKGGQRDWISEEQAITALSAYAQNGFLSLPNYHTLKSPAEMERTLVEAWGESHTENIRLMISCATTQSRYTILQKEKSNG